MRMTLLCFVFWVTPVLAQQVPESDQELTIRDLEHQWLEAQTRSDNRALSLIFDNALIYVEEGVLMTKGDYLSRVKAAGSAPPQFLMNEMSVHVTRGVAIVVGTFREKKLNAGRVSLSRWRFVDTWVEKKGMWVLVAATAAPISK